MLAGIPEAGRCRTLTASALAIISICSTSCAEVPTAATAFEPLLAQSIPPTSTEVYAASWILDVYRDGRVVVTPPVASRSPSTSYRSVVTSGIELKGVAQSTWSAVGARRPGLSHVVVALELAGKAGHPALGAPSAPAAVNSRGGVMLIPIEVTVPFQPGSAASNGDWVTVTMPNEGRAAASTMWPEGPFPFFGDAPCIGAEFRCYRAAALAEPILPGGKSAPVLVGFDIDPTASHLRVRVVVAGDPLD